MAWIIGWDLLMEYAIGNIAVAISWSDYFTSLLASIRIPWLGISNGINIPPYFTMDFLTASRGFAEITALQNQGMTIEAIKALPEFKAATLTAFEAWSTAPKLAGLPVVMDLPALAIVVAITALVYVGIRESKRASNLMVALKLAVIFLVIIVGAYYVDPSKWSPFAPNGMSGVMKGVAAVFFAYVGFDAITTTAEECKNPQKDLPRAMILSLIICTTLYIIIALVLTGMVSYTLLQVGDPLAFVFGPEGVDIPWLRSLVAVSAVIAIATVLLVFQLGQPRIWMAMSRDGLLPPIFSSIHPRFKTPWFSTIITGVFVAVPALFMTLVEVTDLASIGTLFAFVLVCGGVLMLGGKNAEQMEADYSKRFRVPYINGKWIVPALLVIVALLLYRFYPDAARNLVTITPAENETMFGAFSHKIPLIVYLIFALIITVLTFVKNLSLIPVLGLLSCGYLMTELGITNWTRFGIWLLIGLALYFVYGYTHSKLHKSETEARNTS